ncbi:MAG: VOC family protein [Candidatus Odinarchaeota archaeon]
MKGNIALITIITNEVPVLVQFYQEVLGFRIKTSLDEYVEFENEGVRFAICSRSIMEQATGHASYKEMKSGQSFELAFPIDSPEELDRIYTEITKNGAIPVKAPATMPWGQKTAFFADPDGNIHELFTDLPEK